MSRSARCEWYGWYCAVSLFCEIVAKFRIGDAHSRKRGGLVHRDRGLDRAFLATGTAALNPCASTHRWCTSNLLEPTTEVSGFPFCLWGGTNISSTPAERTKSPFWLPHRTSRVVSFCWHHAFRTHQAALKRIAEVLVLDLDIEKPSHLKLADNIFLKISGEPNDPPLNVAEQVPQQQVSTELDSEPTFEEFVKTLHEMKSVSAR